MVSLATRAKHQNNEALNNPNRFQNVKIPGLSQLPILGPVLFDNNIFVYLMFAIVAATYVGLFRTRWGLRVRAVGEHPAAADTVGIRVLFTRYRNVVLGGIVAGIGGAYFTLGAVGRFEPGMTAGRGRYDRHTQYLSSPKILYVYPLRPDFRSRLRRQGQGER